MKTFLKNQNHYDMKINSKNVTIQGIGWLDDSKRKVKMPQSPELSISIYKITSEIFSYKILESFCLCVNPVLAEMYVCVRHILYCKHLYFIVRAVYHRECRIR